MPRKVFVAMSGGVDSSTAAALLKKRGYDVIGVHMRCYNVDGCGEQDAEDAQKTAAHLGIPFYVFDFEKEYKDKVVRYMIDGYKKGITPNPDIKCNKEIKFGLFLNKALAMGADYIATGHYVRIVRKPSELANKNSGAQGYSLYAAKDKTKDQSYFLWTLKQDQLKHCIFPIGDYAKSQVRAMAKNFGLPTADKKDSQGICFLGQVTLVDFLKKYIPEKRGKVLHVSGKELGEHRGSYYYTIGQRHIGAGLHINSNNQRPLYVAEKDVRTNTLILANKEDPALRKKEISLSDVNLINLNYSDIVKNGGIDVKARVRYRQPLQNAKLKVHKSKFVLVFDEPVQFVAPGQSAVFYGENEELLGGGIIKSAK